MITELYNKFRSTYVGSVFGELFNKKRALVDSDDEVDDDFIEPPFKRNRYLTTNVDIHTGSGTLSRLSDGNNYSYQSRLPSLSSNFRMNSVQTARENHISSSLDFMTSGSNQIFNNKENASSSSSFKSKYFTERISENGSKPINESTPLISRYVDEMPKNIIDVEEDSQQSPPLFSSMKFMPSLTSTAQKADCSGLGVTKRKPIKSSDMNAYKFSCLTPSKSGIQKRCSELSRNSKKRSFLSSLAPCGIRKFLTAKTSFRLDEKERYRQLLQQYTTSNIFPRKSLKSSLFSSTIDGNFTLSDVASRTGAIVKTQLDPISTSKSRLLLEKGESCPTPSLKIPSHLSTKLGLSPNFDRNSPSRSEIPVIDLETEVVTENCLDDDDIFVVKEVKPSKPMNNSLENKLQKSPFYNDDWLKDIKQYYQEKKKETDNDVQLIYETKRKCEESRRLCEQNLLDKVAKRISQLDIKYPRRVIEISEEEEIELPELTPEIENIIERAFKGGPPGQVLAEKFNIQITRRDLHTLAGLNWLNDEVINFYMNMIMERGKNDNFPSVYAFNTFFYSKLLKTGYASVKRWTKKIDIFSHDILIIPVHLGMHWCLSTIDFRNKSIKYYDSMLGDNYKCLTELKKYLESEHQDKKKTTYDVNQFSADNVKDIPQQMNGSDCGMFSCKFAEYLSRDAPITFTQEHMPYFRRRMVYEIVTQRLM